MEVENYQVLHSNPHDSVMMPIWMTTDSDTRPHLAGVFWCLSISVHTQKKKVQKKALQSTLFKSGIFGSFRPIIFDCDYTNKKNIFSRGHLAKPSILELRFSNNQYIPIRGSSRAVWYIPEDTSPRRIKKPGWRPFLQL